LRARHVVAPFFHLASALGIFITSSTEALLPADTKFEHFVFEAGNEGDWLVVKLGTDIQVLDVVTEGAGQSDHKRRPAIPAGWLGGGGVVGDGQLLLLQLDKVVMVW
jgi:hypothetical protein